MTCHHESKNLCFGQMPHLTLDNQFRSGRFNDIGVLGKLHKTSDGRLYKNLVPELWINVT